MPWRFQRPIPFTLFHFDRFRACSFFPALSDWLYCLQFTLACLHTGLWLRFWWQPKAEAHMRARRSEPSLGRIEDCSKTCSSIDIINATMPWRFRHESFSCCMMIDSGLGWVHLCMVGLWKQSVHLWHAFCGLIFYHSFFTDDSISIWLCKCCLEQAKSWKMMDKLDAWVESPSIQVSARKTSPPEPDLHRLWLVSWCSLYLKLHWADRSLMEH